jgi:hypothetical protein
MLGYLLRAGKQEDRAERGVKDVGGKNWAESRGDRKVGFDGVAASHRKNGRFDVSSCEMRVRKMPIILYSGKLFQAEIDCLLYRRLSLSTNMIDRLSNLNSLKCLRILSIGRNYLKSLAGVVRKMGQF